MVKKFLSAKRGERSEKSLTRYEQEVVINFNAAEDIATVYSANPAWIRKMDKLAREYPDVIILRKQIEISKTYELPKRLARIRKPKEISEVQKDNLAKMRKCRRLKKID